MAVVPLLKGLITNSIRLIGISLQNLSGDYSRQLTFADLGGIRDKWLSYRWKKALWNLQQRYNVNLSMDKNKTEWNEHLYDVISHMRQNIGTATGGPS